MTAFVIPEVLDNSILSTFRQCQTKGRYAYLDGLVTAGENVNLHAGGVFARAREVVYRDLYAGRDRNFAVAHANFEFEKAWGGFVTAPDANKRKDRVWTALLAYVERYNPPHDYIVPLENCDPFEFSFAIPLDRDHFGLDFPVHPTTGQPFLYAGKFDMIGRKLGTFMTIVDDKTTNALGEKWSNKWSLRSQFIGYVDCMQILGYAVDMVEIRGIAFLKNDITFQSAEKSYTTAVRERWRRQLRADVTNLVRAIDANEFEVAFGDPCADYGGCAFLDLCRSQEPEDWFGEFARRTWNPLANPKGE